METVSYPETACETGQIPEGSWAREELAERIARAVPAGEVPKVYAPYAV